MAGKDCDCGKVKVTEFSQPRPGNAAVATGGSSLISSLVRAAEILGGDTRSMANSELVDALCAALVEAREEKQALAKALDECFEEQERLTDVDDFDDEEGDENDDDFEDESEGS